MHLASQAGQRYCQEREQGGRGGRLPSRRNAGPHLQTGPEPLGSVLPSWVRDIARKLPRQVRSTGSFPLLVVQLSSEEIAQRSLQMMKRDFSGFWDVGLLWGTDMGLGFGAFMGQE